MIKMYIETEGVHLKRHVMFIINDEDVHRNWWSTPKKTCNVHYQWSRCT